MTLVQPAEAYYLEYSYGDVSWHESNYPLCLVRLQDEREHWYLFAYDWSD